MQTGRVGTGGTGSGEGGLKVLNPPHSVRIVAPPWGLSGSVIDPDGHLCTCQGCAGCCSTPGCQAPQLSAHGQRNLFVQQVATISGIHEDLTQPGLSLPDTYVV
jgi:hypothetical protein